MPSRSNWRRSTAIQLHPLACRLVRAHVFRARPLVKFGAGGYPKGVVSCGTNGPSTLWDGSRLAGTRFQIKGTTSVRGGFFSPLGELDAAGFRDPTG